MSTNNVKFIALFVEQRKNLGLTQAKTAEKCGVSPRMWGMYERGETMPSGEVLLKFQEAGADVAFIFSSISTLNAHQDRAGYGEDIGNILHKAYQDADEHGKAALMAVAKLIVDSKK